MHRHNAIPIPIPSLGHHKTPIELLRKWHPPPPSSLLLLSYSSNLPIISPSIGLLLFLRSQRLLLAPFRINTDKPYGIGGGMNLRNGVDASGRKPTGKRVYQYVDKYGANVDGYNPIYNTDEWSPSGDVYVGGTTGLAIWAVTLLGLLAGGALLVYNTSTLAQGIHHIKAHFDSLPNAYTIIPFPSSFPILP